MVSAVESSAASTALYVLEQEGDVAALFSTPPTETTETRAAAGCTLFDEPEVARPVRMSRYLTKCL